MIPPVLLERGGERAESHCLAHDWMSCTFHDGPDQTRGLWWDFLLPTPSLGCGDGLFWGRRPAMPQVIVFSGGASCEGVDRVPDLAALERCTEVRSEGISNRSVLRARVEVRSPGGSESPGSAVGQSVAGSAARKSGRSSLSCAGLGPPSADSAAAYSPPTAMSSRASC